MHGGHYTAFVRVRRELSLNDVSSVSTTPSSTAAATEGATTDVAIENDAKTDTPCECVVDQATMTFGNSVDETDDDEEEGEEGTPSPDPLNAPDSNSTPVRHQQSTSSPSREREFDLESTLDDQWYYISDSHVRKSSLSEVLDCQAYILFYERLPFQKR